MNATGYITAEPQINRKTGATLSLKVKVNALAVRKHFGRTEYLVTPVAGDGEVWKSADSIDWITPPAEVAA